ncbi:MAG TPA: 30S ribosomal protein S14 [Ignavibacteria bacterium]|nr:30S ribosomal protein S14 [Ignavibacteria bacterium]
MAKKSHIARQQKRVVLVERYAAKRKELKEKGDFEGLQKLPRNSSPTRLHNRCSVTGRSRAYYRKFGVSRLVLRELALAGKIPGVRKASW